MLKPKVTDINDTRIVTYDKDHVYIIKPFKGIDNYSILTKLTKYGSKPFGGVLRGIAESGEDVGVFSALIVGCLQDAFVDIDDPKLGLFITDEIVANITRDNSPFNFDEEFKGVGIVRTFDLIKLVISHNYAPVFQELDIAALFKENTATE